MVVLPVSHGLSSADALVAQSCLDSLNRLLTNAQPAVPSNFGPKNTGSADSPPASLAASSSTPGDIKAEALLERLDKDAPGAAVDERAVGSGASWGRWLLPSTWF